MKIEEWSTEIRDNKKIEKLNKLTNPETFWDDCRCLTKNVKSDHGIKRWQCLAEARYMELMCGHELSVKDVWSKQMSDLSQKYFEKDSPLGNNLNHGAQKER